MKVHRDCARGGLCFEAAYIAVQEFSRLLKCPRVAHFILSVPILQCSITLKREWTKVKKKHEMAKKAC